MGKDEFVDAMIDLFSTKKECELLSDYDESWAQCLLAIGRVYVELYCREISKEG